MGYVYSEVDRLKEPHAYMYTPFEGAAFLDSYFSSRMACLDRVARTGGAADLPLLCEAARMLAKCFDANSPDSGAQFRRLAGWNFDAASPSAAAAGTAERLARFTPAEAVATSELLQALLAGIAARRNPDETKLWLDRLCQRFEVTKKLFDRYQPGFRTGEGTNNSIPLYWQFAMALALFHATTGQLKYLSTLLKVCDLLCSLPGDALARDIPPNGLATVLAAEFVSVRRLTELKGLRLGSH